MDETTIKSIDTSRPSDFRFKAVTSERTYQAMIAEKVVEPIAVIEEPKVSIDTNSDDSRPASEEPKELRQVDDDLSDVFQPEGKIRIYIVTTNAYHNPVLRIRRTSCFSAMVMPFVSKRSEGRGKPPKNSLYRC